MLDGVKVYELKKLPDERGFFAELLRRDWKDLLGDEWVVQANLSYSYPGIIRAWHRHLKGQVDYFIVLKGAMKICAYDEKTRKMDEIVASEQKLQIVRIPGHYYHGTKTLGNEPSLTLYFVTRLYDYGNPDEERKLWNDSAIIDSKMGSPYDWEKPPHK
jgi:dTDP-4-dehydrorhamnose 3,5-epimerase